MAQYWFRGLAVLVLMAFAGGAQAQADEYLTPHNEARSAVNVPSLVWDRVLEDNARTYAQSQAGKCLPLTHSNGAYGENLYWRSPSATPAQAVAGWVDEKQNYDYASNSCVGGECGHYTQVVWANTRKVGCASVECTDSSGGTYIICSYDPPGNVGGQKPY